MSIKWRGKFANSCYDMLFYNKGNKKKQTKNYVVRIHKIMREVGFTEKDWRDRENWRWSKKSPGKLENVYPPTNKQ